MKATMPASMPKRAGSDSEAANGPVGASAACRRSWPRSWAPITAAAFAANLSKKPRWGDGQLMGIGLLVRKEGAAGRWQYPPPEQKPFPLDPADALGASRQAQLDSIWNDFA